MKTKSNKKQRKASSTNNNIIFLGGGLRAIPLLKEVIKRKDYSLKSAIFNKSYPDEPQSNIELGQIAKKYGIRCYTISKLNQKIIEEAVRIDPVVIVGGGIWRTYIPESFYNCGMHGMYTAHGSLLPEYKGFCPINWYMINGEKECGLQMFKLSERIDSGKLVYRKKDNTLLNRIIPIKVEYMISDLLKETIKANTDIWMEFLDLVKEGGFYLKEQDLSKETWTCHRGPDDGRIDWNQPNKKVYDFIRAQSYPYPGAFSYYKKEKVYFWKVRLSKNALRYTGVIPGKIVKIDKQNQSIWVLTKDGIIEVLEVSFKKSKNNIKSPVYYFNSVREKFE